MPEKTKAGTKTKRILDLEMNSINQINNKKMSSTAPRYIANLQSAATL